MKRKYKQASAETRRKMSIAHKNKRHSQTTKSLISSKMKKYWAGLKTTHQ